MAFFRSDLEVMEMLENYSNRFMEHQKTEIISDIVRYHSKNNGNHPALIYNGCITTYHSLNIKSSRVANLLIASSIGPKSRVAYLGKESNKYYEILFACAKAGCVVVPINWRLKMEEVKYILNDSKATIIFLDEEFSEMVVLLKNNVKTLSQHIFLQKSTKENYYDYDTWIKLGSDKDPILHVEKTDTFVQMYTSGTTGYPKGVELSHESFFKIQNSLIENNLDWLDWNHNDISFIGISGFHIGGLWWAIQGFSSGATNISVSVFTVQDVIEIIEKYKVTISCFVPAMINMLLQEMLRTNRKWDLTSLRKIVYGGAPASELLINNAARVFNCQFAQIYGLTETGNTAVCLPWDAYLSYSGKTMPTGKPYPCTKIKIINESGESLPAYNVGEVLIHSPAIMKSYWRMPMETQQILINGWLKTGDAGYIDENGFLYICDRIKDVIIVAGEKIYPVEVEIAISKHPKVHDCAVVGIPDKNWGERVIAFIVLKTMITILKKRELVNFLRDTLADYKIPSDFYFLQEIPRTSSGKILRRDLKENMFLNI